MTLEKCLHGCLIGPQQEKKWMTINARFPFFWDERDNLFFPMPSRPDTQYLQVTHHTARLQQVFHWWIGCSIYHLLTSVIKYCWSFIFEFCNRLPKWRVLPSSPIHVSSFCRFLSLDSFATPAFVSADSSFRFSLCFYLWFLMMLLSLVSYDASLFGFT